MTVRMELTLVLAVVLFSIAVIGGIVDVYVAFRDERRARRNSR